MRVACAGTVACHPYEPFRLLEVVPPVRPDRLLATDVPKVESKPNSRRQMLGTVRAVLCALYKWLHAHPLCSSVLILNPRVGSMPEIDSPLNFCITDVFPALSSPLYSEGEMID